MRVQIGSAGRRLFTGGVRDLFEAGLNEATVALVANNGRSTQVGRGAEALCSRTTANISPLIQTIFRKTCSNQIIAASPSFWEIKLTCVLCLMAFLNSASCVNF